MEARMKKILLLVAALGLVAAAVGAQDALVTTEWLADNLRNPNVKVVEVSVNPGVYERGHIFGASNFRWHTDLVDTVQRDIISEDGFEQLLSRAGIDNDDTVILYGDTNNWFAAWGAWIFEIYGHEDVRLLDGGRVKWEAENRPLTTAAPRARRTNYRVSSVNEDLRAFRDDVIRVARSGRGAQLIDIRSPAEYSGQILAPPGVEELSVRAGHVPGAVNVPWGRAVNEDGTFKSASELRRLYASEGIDGSQPIITYCRIGERSSHTWFALHRILGYEVKNYDGSWTEYGNSVGVPIENPAGTVWGGQ
jgi:thiosulfate/3-mercaptopyruvate sulfurtransferase